MSHVKPNPKISDDLSQRIIQLRGDIEEAREIGSLKDDPRWDRIRTIYKANLDAVESILDRAETLDEKGVRFYLKERIDIKRILSIVEDADDTIAALTKDLHNCEHLLNERNKRNGNAPA